MPGPLPLPHNQNQNQYPQSIEEIELEAKLSQQLADQRRIHEANHPHPSPAWQVGYVFLAILSIPVLIILVALLAHVS